MERAIVHLPYERKEIIGLKVNWEPIASWPEEMHVSTREKQFMQMLTSL